MLGEILRSSRMALLFGELGSDKTALLKQDLMPLLRRHANDLIAPVAARANRAVIPFPDPRSSAPALATKGRREIVVYFDTWTETPLAALHACVHHAAATRPSEPTAGPTRLSETLATLSDRLNASFIILLDRFEEFLQAPARGEDAAQFMNELVEAVNQAELPANFLISVNEAARPRLANLRSRIAGFDDFSLKLANPPGFQPLAVPLPPCKPAVPNAALIRTLPVLKELIALPPVGGAPLPIPAIVTPRRHAPRPPKVKLPPLVRLPLKTQDVYEFIEATLAHTAAEIPSDAFAIELEPVDTCRVRVPAARTPHTRLDAAKTAPPGALGPQPSAPTRGATLDAVANWLGRRLRLKSGPGS